MSDCCLEMPSLQKFSHFCFDLAARLGAGTSSCVFRGFDLSNSETVAVKLIEPPALKLATQKLLLEQEKKVWEVVRNGKMSNVIGCKQIIEESGRLHLVMDFYPGGDVNKLVQSGKLCQQRAKSILKNIISGYLQLHACHIVHRDLKPDNILLAADGRAVIGDLGFAVLQEQEVKRYSYIVGSPAYLAPECLEKAEFGLKTDVWALGVLTYVMLEGKTPWKGKNQKDFLNKLKTIHIDSFIEGKDYDPALVHFMKRALAVDAKKRMGAAELAAFYEQFEGNPCSPVHKNSARVKHAASSADPHRKNSHRKRGRTARVDRMERSGWRSRINEGDKEEWLQVARVLEGRRGGDNQENTGGLNLIF